ncbi:hypothetical protein [Methanococcus aeolicus]|uniref:hypothetical protein n=1 Tax=Methanococcus aeolicus TaxID=42879 RepID=UPI0021C7ABBD|nr:hypothetical protein [Methanococcus aeolicus]UXM84207.1 hypothetical protein N6C89_05460 [Methanococcus aeolicus]
MNGIIRYTNNNAKTLFNIDEIDKQAIAILANAPLMTEKEMKIATNRLKIMAKKKKIRGRRNIGDILDDWAYKAYTTTMESIQ